MKIGSGEAMTSKANKQAPAGGGKTEQVPQGQIPRHEIFGWRDFHDRVDPFLDGRFLFRGLSNARWTLKPSVGRLIERPGDLPERTFFESFKRASVPLLSGRPASDWQWLALAQHYGTPTRLLDWSETPLVALYFAVWENDELDGVVHVVPRPPDRPLDASVGPFEVTETVFFYPEHVSPRIVAQRGLFTVHPDPTQVYSPEGGEQIIINKAAKPELRRKLDAVGFHHAFIEADLDGLSRRIRALHQFEQIVSLDPTAPLGDASQVKLSAELKPKGKRNPLDPQKGQWGGSSQVGPWRLSATVEEARPNWFEIVLEVSSVKANSVLKGDVVFHLHDTFDEPVLRVRARGGKATIPLGAVGAFTVGAVVTSDGTELELDLAELESAPMTFRLR